MEYGAPGMVIVNNTNIYQIFASLGERFQSASRTILGNNGNNL